MFSKIPWKRIDWRNTSFLLIPPPLMVLTTYWHVTLEGLNLWLFVPAIIMYFVTGYSITLGYHRLFSHKAFKAHPAVQIFTLIFGSAAFQNSVLKWGSDHRRHHAQCDREKDPYNISKGFFWAHIGWVLVKEEPQYRNKFAKDLENNPLVAWQHQHNLSISIVVGLIFPTLLGIAMGSPIGGIAIIALARLVMVHHCTFFINSLCHMVGNRPYTASNSARDSWLIAFFSFGEGYHNFHHFFQNDYRNGVRWYQYDPTKWIVYLLSKIGLTSGLIRTPEEEILKARFMMQQIEYKGELALSSPSTFLGVQKIKLEEALKNINKLKQDYQKLRQGLEVSGANSLADLNRKIKIARHELRATFNVWLVALKRSHLQYS